MVERHSRLGRRRNAIGRIRPQLVSPPERNGAKARLTIETILKIDSSNALIGPEERALLARTGMLRA